MPTVALMLQCRARLSSVRRLYVLWLNGAYYRKSVWRTNRKWPMGNRMVTWPM